MNAKFRVPDEEYPWVIRTRPLEIETIAALYRELLARRRLGPTERTRDSQWLQFSFDQWLRDLLEEVRGGLGAQSFGLGFFVRPGSELRRVMLARRNKVWMSVDLRNDLLPPEPMPSVASPFGGLVGVEGRSSGATVWWGIAVGDPPLHRHVAVFTELPPGDAERQRRLVEAAAIAVWATIRDVLLEFVQPELWETSGLDPYRLFHVGEKRAAYLFADIRGFTGLTDMITRNAQSGNSSRSPTVNEIMNAYAREMQSVVKAYGRIDKFMGDGIMAVFGDATEEESPQAACQAAVSAATNMLEKFTELEHNWKKEWIESFLGGGDEGIELFLGIGISYGLASFTFVSTEASRHYTPVGSCVNLAQRLEQAAGMPRQGSKLRGSILVSATVQRQAGDLLSDGTKIRWDTAELIQPKGVPYPLQTYWATRDG